MGVVIPLHGFHCNNKPNGEEVQILSERHQEVLRERFETRIKLVAERDIELVRVRLQDKLDNIGSCKDFVLRMSARINLLYTMLFDSTFLISRRVKKTIAAGLLYFLSPGDFLPDDIPGLGFLDDAFIITLTMEKARPYILQYIHEQGLDEKTYY